MRFRLFLIMSILMIGLAYALPTIPTNSIYIDTNVSSPIVLLPQDIGVYNIKLYTANQSFNFTWTGSQYELYILFNAEGNYPFVINSTDVTGEITGTFLSRVPYNVTINLYNSKASIIPLISNRYKNDFGYILAELSDGTNVYEAQNQKYTLPLNFKTTRTKFFHTPYLNGQAKLKLWERNQYYDIRFVDGSIAWDGVYSRPNVTKTYGVNAYLGNYLMNGTSKTMSIYVSSDDLYPFRNVLNWSLIIAIVFVIVIIIVFATQFPTASVLFGIFSIATLIGMRIIAWYWIGS